MTDSPKHSTTLHIFDDIQNLVKNGQGHQVTETSEKIIKLVDLLHSQAKGKNLDAPTAYATQLAQTYYAHKLVNVNNTFIIRNKNKLFDTLLF